VGRERVPLCAAPTTETDPPSECSLTDRQRHALRSLRRTGLFGALLLAFGSLGAGALPVPNPVLAIPVLRILPRLPAVSLALASAGMGVILVCWMLLGRFARAGRLRRATPGEIRRVSLTWTVPFLAVPPLFSRDVYSYLAQGKIVLRGMDPYALGPAEALGDDDPLTTGVDPVWQDTPAPYGPLFLRLAALVIRLTGDHVYLGILLQRTLALLGVALIVWALPRLATRFGASRTTALWLGAANPLVLFHLVGGMHNEALAIGLMMAGLEVGLRRLPERAAGEPSPSRRRGELGSLVLGVVIISTAAAVKVNALVALGFFAVLIARRGRGRFRDLLVVGSAMLVTAVGTLAGLSIGSGLGFGWIRTLSTPGLVPSYMSPVSELASLGALLGGLLGFGDQRAGLLAILQALGMLLAAGVTVKFLADGMRRRHHPVIGLAASLGAFMVLHQSTHPWWLLWALIPLAVAAITPRLRSIATAVSVVPAFLVFPTGGTFEGRIFVVEQAYLAGLVVVGGVTLLLRWRHPELLRWPRPPQPRRRHPRAAEHRSSRPWRPRRAATRVQPAPDEAEPRAPVAERTSYSGWS